MISKLSLKSAINKKLNKIILLNEAHALPDQKLKFNNCNVCANFLTIDVEKNSSVIESILMQLQIYFYKKYFGVRLGDKTILNL